MNNTLQGSFLLQSLTAVILLCMCVQSAFADSPNNALDVIVLLDDSGSLYGNKKDPAQDPAFVRLTAIQCLSRKLRSTDRLAVIPFGTTALSKYSIGFISPGSAFAAVTKPLADRSKVGAQQQDSTNYGAAIESVESLLAQEAKERKRIVLFLTDGKPNPRSLKNSDDKLIDQCKRLKTKLDVSVYTVSLGNDPDEGLLEQLSESSGGRHFHVSNPRDLPSVFADVIRYAGDREVRASIKENSFAIARGTQWLNAVAVDSDPNKKLRLVSPSGKKFSGEFEVAIFPAGQVDKVCHLSVDNPEHGVWRFENADIAPDVSVASTLRVRIVSPANNEVISSDQTLKVNVDVDQFDGRGVLSGVAQITGLTNGKPTTFPLSFTDNHGRLDIPLQGLSDGFHFVEVRVQQSVENSMVDAIPDRVQVSVITAAPGVPTVSLQWAAGANEFRTAFGRPVTVSVPLLANKEAQAKEVNISASDGWIVSPSTYAINATSSRLTLSLSPKSSFGRMKGDVTIKLVAKSDELVVNNGDATLHVTQFGWIDMVSAAVRFLLIPAILVVVFLSGMVLVSKQKAKLRRNYRKWLFEHVSIMENNVNILTPFSSKGGSMCRYGNILKIDNGNLVPQPDCGWLRTTNPMTGELFRISIRLQAKPGAMMYVNAPMTVDRVPTTRAVIPSDAPITIRLNIGHGFTLGIRMQDNVDAIRNIRACTVMFYSLLAITMVFIAISLYLISGNIDQLSFSDANLV